MKIKTLILFMLLLTLLTACSSEITYTKEQIEENNKAVELFVEEQSLSSAKADEIVSQIKNDVLNGTITEPRYKSFIDFVTEVKELYVLYVEDEDKLTVEELLDTYLSQKLYIDRATNTSELIISLKTENQESRYLSIILDNGEVKSVEEIVA